MPQTVLGFGEGCKNRTFIETWGYELPPLTVVMRNSRLQLKTAWKGSSGKEELCSASQLSLLPAPLAKIYPLHSSQRDWSCRYAQGLLCY